MNGFKKMHTCVCTHSSPSVFRFYVVLVYTDIRWVDFVWPK